MGSIESRNFYSYKSCKHEYANCPHGFFLFLLCAKNVALLSFAAAQLSQYADDIVCHSSEQGSPLIRAGEVSIADDGKSVRWRGEEWEVFEMDLTVNEARVLFTAAPPASKL